MFDIEYAGYTGKDKGIIVTRRPDIPAPVEIIESYRVPGRDGELIAHTGTYEDIEIEIPFGFRAPKDQWAERFRQCRKWLLAPGVNRLQFSDDPDFFRISKYVEITDTERTIKKMGEFSAIFTCSPYIYAIEGEYEIPAVDLYNNYEVSHPIYYIEGEGVCRIAVNGKEVSINVGQNATIDTDLMIAYRQDKTIMNAETTGDYDDLWLKPGLNTITTTVGFLVTLKPRWRSL
ncbi:distal tail protein Dit [Diplocloster hominis]|uniref:distal tail protein Dit n=1 Tax=Diplocloster hominis TaxID=3079010 RepID=UPI0031BAE11B